MSTEQDGAAPPMATTPPCGGTVDPSQVAKAFQCMEEYCDSTPDSGVGTLTGGTNCLQQYCTGPLAALLLGYPDPVCYDCIVDGVASNEAYTDVCVQRVHAAAGVALGLQRADLAAHPLALSHRRDRQVPVLPSTNYRQAVLYSRVQLPGDLQVDFYCTFLTSTLIASEVPYVGDYGAGGAPTTSGAGGAYANEQLYQAQLLSQWVKQKSGTTTPAIVAGDWRSGLGPGDGGLPPADAGTFAVPVPLVAPTIQSLFDDKDFTPATASAWAAAPQCNFCPGAENPLNSGQGVGYFVSQPFLVNWGPGAGSATVGEGLLYTSAIIQTPDVDAEVPPSQYYGVTVSVLRPQTQ